MKPSVRASSVEGLRRELKDLRRSVMDLHRITGDVGGTEPLGEAEVEAGGGAAGPTFVIAAADANDESKAVAHYQCDGTDDDLIINQAIAAFGDWAGRLLFTEGSFYITGPITRLPGGTIVQGMGYSTYFELSYYAYAFSTGGSAVLRDFSIYGMGSPLPQTGIESGGADDLVQNVDIKRVDEAVILSASANRCHVIGCRLSGSVRSVDVDNGARDSLVQGCYLAGDLLMSGSRNMVVDTRFAVGSSISVSAPSTDAAFAHNFLPGGLAAFTDAGTTTQRGTNFATGGTW